MNEDNNNNIEKKIPTIHTLESDLASAVNDENYGKNIIKIVTDPDKNSTFSDNATGDEQRVGIFNQKWVIISIIIFIIIILSSIAVYFLYISNINKDTQTEGGDVVATTTSTLVPVIKNKNFLQPEIIQNSDFTNLNRNEIVSEINKIKTDLNNKKIVSNNNIEIGTNLNIEQFFEKIRYSGNDSLIRSFDNIYSFGIYSRDNGKFENYILIKVNSFDLAFKSILDWERYMPTDLKDIFIGNNSIINQISATTTQTTSATSSDEKKYYAKDTNVFVDRIIKNQDIREYVKNSDDLHIIYGFINNKFLLITSGESSFIDIKDRLLKENISR